MKVSLIYKKTFASNADVLTPLPETADDNNVSYTTGYTNDYTLNLFSNVGTVLPNAKPIERGIYNFLLNNITAAQYEWMTQTFPNWDKDTEYVVGGIVYHVNNSDPFRQPLPNSFPANYYRAVKENKNVEPGTDGTTWEHVFCYKYMAQYMQKDTAGGTDYTKYYLTTRVNFNEWDLASGTLYGRVVSYSFMMNDDVIALCDNTPTQIGSTNLGGNLEFALANPFAGTARDLIGVQKFTAYNNFTYLRSCALQAFYYYRAVALYDNTYRISGLSYSGDAVVNPDINHIKGTLPWPAIQGDIFPCPVTVKLPADSRGAGGQLNINLGNGDKQVNPLSGNSMTGSEVYANGIVDLITYPMTYTMVFSSGPGAQANNIAVATLGLLLGGVSISPVAAIPSGYLECNGATVNKTQYPNLVELLNHGQDTAVIPDMRGRFMRGYDNGKGTDAGRILLSAQGTSIITHNHSGTFDTAGAHVHAVVVDSGGTHQHAGTVDLGGDHQHQAGPAAPGAQWGSFTKGSDNDYDYGAYFTSVNGAHQHTYTMSGGDHNHTASTASAGDHHHTFVTNLGEGYGAETRPRNIALMYVIRAQ